MKLFALILVLIPFFSIPPFIFSSYVQPAALFIGWSLILYIFRLRISRNLFVCLASFFAYSLFLKIFIYSPNLSLGDISVLLAYTVGFSQLLLFHSLFKYILDSSLLGNSFPFKSVQKAINVSITLVVLSIPLQILPPFAALMQSIKPRSLSLSEDGLANSYRGLSGLMPEPSYIGTCLSTLLLTSFILGYLHFLHLSYRSSDTDNLSAPLVTLDLRGYSTYFKSFFFSNLSLLLGSVFAVFLAFSPTSLLSFFLILAVPVIPFVTRIFYGFINVTFMRSFVLIALFMISFLYLSSQLFPLSRVSALIDFILSGDLSIKELTSFDKSVADRYASTALGVFSSFSYPIGLGLNGHGFLMSDCSNPLVESLDLLCGSIFSSDRNHNAYANLAIDAGFLSFVWLYLVLTQVARVNHFIRFPLMPVYLKYAFVLIPISLAFLFTILPAPLGSPFLWLPFALSLSCLQYIPLIYEESLG